MFDVKVKLIPGAGGAMPEYQTEGASGVDLRASAGTWIPAGGVRLISTGICVQIPAGYEGQVRPRSGLAAKRQLTVLNTPGTIDSDYTGEVKVIMQNHNNSDQEILVGDRIAQLVICPVVRVNLIQVEELDSTDRGAGGFGSTGVK